MKNSIIITNYYKEYSQRNFEQEEQSRRIYATLFQDLL